MPAASAFHAQCVLSVNRTAGAAQRTRNQVRFWAVPRSPLLSAAVTAARLHPLRLFQPQRCMHTRADITHTQCDEQCKRAIGVHSADAWLCRCEDLCFARAAAVARRHIHPHSRISQPSPMCAQASASSGSERGSPQRAYKTCAGALRHSAAFVVPLTPCCATNPCSHTAAACSLVAPHCARQLHATYMGGMCSLMT